MARARQEGRSKAGRPKAHPEESKQLDNDTTVIRIGTGLKRCVKDRAKRRGITISALIVEILSKEIKRVETNEARKQARGRFKAGKIA